MSNKFKHLTLSDRCVIHEQLTAGASFSKISELLNKDRTTIAKEVKHHRYPTYKPTKYNPACPKTAKPPYVCNGCSKKDDCPSPKYLYSAEIAHATYMETLVSERSDIRIPPEKIAEINEVIAPLMKYKHHSINHVYAAHADVMTISKSSMYRLIDRGLLSVRNIDLARKVRCC